MPDKPKNVEEGVFKAVWKKLSANKTFLNLWGKIASGAGVLAILGYLFSWGFVTINSLENKVSKLEEREQEDKAQWTQILRLSQETRENEIEIKVLQKLYDIQGLSVSKGNDVKEPPKPDKRDEAIRQLAEKLKKLEEENKRSAEQFRNEAIQQQMIQRPLPKAK